MRYPNDLKEFGGLAVGNKVRVREHSVTTMSGDVASSWLSGKEGYILSFGSDYKFDARSLLMKANVRIYHEKKENSSEYEFATNCVIDLRLLELLDASSVGPVIPGTTCPYSRAELRELFAAQKLKEIEKFDFSVEGYKNMATHLAALYLNQDSRFHNQLARLRRQHGTINAEKVRKAFENLHLTVEAEAFETPLPFAKVDLFFYRDIQFALQKAQAIDWNEVAEDFVEETV